MGWIASLVLFIGSTASSVLLNRRTEQKPPGSDEIDFPTLDSKAKRAIVWGRAKRSGPNILWWGDYRAYPETDEDLWGRESTVGFRHHFGIQFGLCAGELDELTRVWMGDQIILDTPIVGEGTGDIYEPRMWGGEALGQEGGVVGVLEFYPGSKTQSASSYLQGLQGGVTETPAYRGMAHAVWRGPSAGFHDLVDSGTYEDVNGDDQPNYNWRGHRYLFFPLGYLGMVQTPAPLSFEVKRIPNGLGLSGGKEVCGAGGANLANVFYDMLTNADWGMGESASDIDTTNFSAAADVFYTEGNGFDFAWVNESTLDDVWRIVEEQGDCFCHFNRNTEKWEIKLIRADYTLGSLPVLDSSNVLRVEEWKVPLWDDTKNQVFASAEVYSEKVKNWITTVAHSPDIANFNAQGGKYESVDVEFPGCSDRDLLEQLSARRLRVVSRPLRFGTMLVDRVGWDINPGDVLRFSYEFADGSTVTDMPIRIRSVRLGEIEKNEIRLDFDEDVFFYYAGLTAAPNDSDWEDPITVPDPIPTDEDVIEELPRAIAVRSPAPGSFDRLLLGCRYQNDGASRVPVFTRHASGSPTGAYDSDTTILRFLPVGALNAALPQDTTNPTTSGTEDIRVDPTPSAVVELLAAFDTLTATAGDIGANLYNLVKIDDEILAVTTVVDNTTHILLRVAYRGFMDTTPRPHALGSSVFVLQASVGERSYPRTNNVDVQLRPESSSGAVLESTANTVLIALADRGRAPYPTTAMELNGTLYDPGTVSLDDTTTGSGLDAVGVNIDVAFRDRDVYDQVLAITAGLADDTVYDTNVQLRVTKDPSTSPVLLFSTSMVDADVTNLPLLASRTEILANNAGVVPSELRIETILEHTVPDPDGGSDITINDYQHDTWEGDVASSALSGLDVHGVLDNGDVGSFTADATDTYVFTIGTSLLSSGVLEAENATAGGGYSTVIATSGTTGTLAGVTAGDTINFRHTQGGSDNLHTHLAIQQQTGSVDEGFAILRI